MMALGFIPLMLGGLLLPLLSLVLVAMAWFKTGRIERALMEMPASERERPQT